MSKYIGLKDKNGNKIHVGDKVEFYFDADRGYSKTPNPDYTTMIDEVIEHEGEFYFLDHYTGGGAFAWRHAPYCKVIGKWSDEDSEQQADPLPPLKLTADA